MAINAGSILKHAFGSLKTSVGKKVVGLFFVIQALNIGSSLMMEAGTGAMVAVSVGISLLTTVLAILATIGSLRSFREGEVKSEFFTSNLLWPFGRILGSNITTAVLAYGVGFLFVLPAGILGLLTGAASPEAIASSGGLALVLSLLGLLMGLGAFLWVTVTLILAQPLVAIDDKRMFQALDESVQRTKGHRSSILSALIGLVLIILIAAIVLGGIGTVAPDIVVTIGVLLLGPVVSAVTLSLLNYLTEELPEA